MKLSVERKIEFVSQAYRNTQDMISLADSKASITLTVQSLLISIGLGSSIFTNAFGRVQNLNDDGLFYLFYVLIGGFVLSSTGGIVISMWVYKARLNPTQGEKSKKGLLYFGHVAQFPTSGDYRSGIDTLDDNRILDELSQQVYNLSHIAVKKMRLVNASVYFLFSNLILAIAVILLSGYVSLQ